MNLDYIKLYKLNRTLYLVYYIPNTMPSNNNNRQLQPNNNEGAPIVTDVDNIDDVIRECDVQQDALRRKLRELQQQVVNTFTSLDRVRVREKAFKAYKASEPDSTPVQPPSKGKRKATEPIDEQTKGKFVVVVVVVLVLTLLQL